MISQGDIARDIPVLDPSSMMRMVNAPSANVSPAVAGTKLMGTSGIDVAGGGPSDSTVAIFVELAAGV